MITTELEREREQYIGSPVQPNVARDLIEFLCGYVSVLWKDWPRRMDISSFSPSSGQFVLNGECPHCGSLAAFLPVTGSYRQEGSPLGDRWIEALQCVACHGFILGIIGMVPTAHGNSVQRYLDHYPLGEAPQVVTDDIPSPILADFNEALRCQSVQAYNATAEMCRRALQGSCLSLGADPKLKLEAQIDWLASKGTITNSLKEMAHTVRLGGNRGAHPSDDLSDEGKLVARDADALISFAWHYLESVYVQPAQMGRFDFSKSGLKKLKS